jgi:ABC-type transporter Mla MlaB component
MAGRGSATARLTIGGRLTRADLPALYERTCELLEGGGIELLSVDVAGIAIDAVAVDALARLALAARRRACAIELCGASAELRDLLELMGLSGVLVPAG